MGELEIVKMQSKHLNDIAELEKMCFSSPWSYSSLEEELLNPNAVFFAAELNDKTVGYAGMHHICDEGYITNIAVHPSHRRRGIAAQLLQTLIEYAHENGLAFITLEVRISNNAALELYKKEGFIKEGIRREFYTKPCEDALILTKRFRM